MNASRAFLLLSLAGVAALFAYARTPAGARHLEGAVSAVKNVTDKARALIAGEEGLSLDAYQDPGAGAWTIGWGHLILPHENFHPYGPIRRITREEADALFERDLADARRAVLDFVHVRLTENQRAALESFVFNIGRTAFRESTLLRKLNLGDIEGAAREFDRWVYDNGKRIDGLAARRDREQELFLA